jgi:hypothetical protein
MKEMNMLQITIYKLAGILKLETVQKTEKSLINVQSKVLTVVILVVMLRALAGVYQYFGGTYSSSG